jgi:2-oxoglutarate ferredoxin oxidoreductase subunit alpha
MLCAGHGHYQRVIATPTDIMDCFRIIPEIHNLADRFQCPGIVLTDLLLSEGHLSVDPEELDFDVEIDRGELITSNGDGNNGARDYKRYLFTESGVSPRAIPGVPGYTHTVATDEHMEDGVLISDEFTDTGKRRDMMDKRQRKIAGIEASVKPPELIGPADADVTLIGWGSTKGVIQEACEILAEDGISANQLQIRWMVPLHGEAIVEILKNSRHIRKYDGEPFMPHHIVEAVKEQLAGRTRLSVPAHEIRV